MNIDDVKTEGISIPVDIFVQIFAHQKTLMEKYDKIEQRNGALVPHAPYNVNARLVQYRLKDLFWRCAEELAEATEKTPTTADWRQRFELDSDLRHFFEEIADAVHFLVEASIIAGYDPLNIDAMEWDGSYIEEPDEIEFSIWKIVKAMGLTANTLKNKPWKNSEMPTDETLFKNRMHFIWCAMVDTLGGIGLEPPDLYLLYMRKNSVNQFRQRSNY